MVSLTELEHAGHRGIELIAGEVRLIALSSVGPRIAWFGYRERENLLYWDAAGEHRRGAWQLYGGHRLWVTRPLADESAETYEPDNQACGIEYLPGGARITQSPTSQGIEKSMAITVDGGVWTIEHRLRNLGGLLWAGGAWALTCTLPHPDTLYRIPLGGGPPTWDVTTIVIPRRWGGTHSSRLDDPQVTFVEDAMEVRAQRDETKRLVLAPRGELEMHDPARGLFRKRTSFEPETSYPLGTNVAIYVGPDRFMVELETMSPLRTLPPGATLTHVERWTLESF
jgi:hypothetical protein